MTYTGKSFETITERHHREFAEAQDNLVGNMWDDGERLSKLEKYTDFSYTFQKGKSDD